ncbi:MAG: hypothetical protein MZU97_17335 [Bacillus subtilis]|nr:hypothetical protein [Bacillus subtilis]
MDEYGNIRPFSQIVLAEQTHINLLLPLFEAYGIEIPVNTAAGICRSSPTASKRRHRHWASRPNKRTSPCMISSWPTKRFPKTSRRGLRTASRRFRQTFVRIPKRPRLRRWCQDIANLFKGQGQGQGQGNRGEGKSGCGGQGNRGNGSQNVNRQSQAGSARTNNPSIDTNKQGNGLTRGSRFFELVALLDWKDLRDRHRKDEADIGCGPDVRKQCLGPPQRSCRPFPGCSAP